MSDPLDPGTVPSRKRFSDDLQDHFCYVKFLKNDGSEREMVVTTKAEGIPVENQPKGTGKSLNPDTTTMIRGFSVADDGWRTFSSQAVIAFTAYITLDDAKEAHPTIFT